MLAVTVLVISIVFSCSQDKKAYIDAELLDAIRRNAPSKDVTYYIMPEDKDYVSLPNEDPSNPMTEEKVQLGRLLFFETGLAQHPRIDACYETYSCSQLAIL